MGRKRPRLLAVTLALVCCSTVLASCTGSRAEAQSAEAPVLVDPGAEHPKTVERAIAVLRPTTGHFVSGLVRFRETPAGLRVEARVEGLGLGQHPYAVHQAGDCSGADAATAGPALDIAKASGEPGDDGEADDDDQDSRRNEGNLGKLVTGLESVASDKSLVKRATLHGPSSIIGRSVVVIAGNDPTSVQQGIAGDRLACGVIGIEE